MYSRRVEFTEIGHIVVSRPIVFAPKYLRVPFISPKINSPKNGLKYAHALGEIFLGELILGEQKGKTLFGWR